jgi:hypothetical protein
VKKPVVCRYKHLLDIPCAMGREDLLFWKGYNCPSDPRDCHREFTLLGPICRRLFLSAFANWYGAKSQLRGQKAKLSLELGDAAGAGGGVGRRWRGTDGAVAGSCSQATDRLKGVSTERRWLVPQQLCWSLYRGELGKKRSFQVVVP